MNSIEKQLLIKKPVRLLPKIAEENFQYHVLMNVYANFIHCQ